MSARASPSGAPLPWRWGRGRARHAAGGLDPRPQRARGTPLRATHRPQVPGLRAGHHAPAPHRRRRPVRRERPRVLAGGQLPCFFPQAERSGAPVGGACHGGPPARAPGACSGHTDRCRVPFAGGRRHTGYRGTRVSAEPMPRLDHCRNLLSIPTWRISHRHPATGTCTDVGPDAARAMRSSGRSPLLGGLQWLGRARPGVERGRHAVPSGPVCTAPWSLRLRGGRTSGCFFGDKPRARTAAPSRALENRRRPDARR
jgi:hypothetical protein